MNIQKSVLHNPIRFNRIRPGYVLALILMAGCCFSLPAHAQWTGGIEGGTIFREDGNATRLRVRAENQSRPLSHFVYADWIRPDGGSNAFELGYRPRYWFSPRFYSFAEASIRTDRPILIDRQTLLLGGVGYSAISTPKQALFVEAGIGTRDTELVAIDGVPRQDLDESLTLLRAGYRQVLSDLLKLEVDLDLLDSESLRQTLLETGISVRIPGGAIKFSYRLRRIEPEGEETLTDDDSFISFSYGF